MIHNATPRPLFQTDGMSPYECTYGVQGDISPFCNFDWYEWVYYRDSGSFPQLQEKLGRVLGPCKNQGSEMSQNILTSKATVVPRRTLRPLTRAEQFSESEQTKRVVFENGIRRVLGQSLASPSKRFKSKDYIPYSEGDMKSEDLHLIDEDPVTDSGSAMFEQPIMRQITLF